MRACFLAVAPLLVLVGCSSSEDSPPADTGTAVGDTPIVDTTTPEDTPGVDTAPSGTPCEASLTAWCTGKDCPKDIDDAPTAGMCAAAKSGVTRSTTACANWQIIQFVDGAGETQNVYYNSSTGVLSGWTKGTGTSETCVAGKTGFRFPNYVDCGWVFGADLCLTLDAGSDAPAPVDAPDGG